ncbi:hypothetical protein V8E36_005929 [Tilletia maclaganii]
MGSLQRDFAADSPKWTPLRCHSHDRSLQGLRRSNRDRSGNESESAHAPPPPALSSLIPLLVPHHTSLLPLSRSSTLSVLSTTFLLLRLLASNFRSSSTLSRFLSRCYSWVCNAPLNPPKAKHRILSYPSTFHFLSLNSRAFSVVGSTDALSRSATALEPRKMRVAVQGCSHGELDHIYDRVLARERDENQCFDVLLLCGDFQAIRNHADLHSLAVPDKYRQLGSFWKYYAGIKRAPLLTIVIGGNHEASNYMFELYYGGWLAPNIYFLGEAGCVEVGDLVISGISGIYKRHDYQRGRYERQPYDKSDLRSIYHTRIYDVERLKLLPKTDIHMSHDWPNTIELHGDTQALIKKKPFFADEIRTHTLGSPPLLELLQTLKPLLWCSAHLHVRFDATFSHRSSSNQTSAPVSLPVQGHPTRLSAAAAADPNQITIDDLDDSDEETLNPSASSSSAEVARNTSAPAHDFGDGEEPLAPREEVAAPTPPVDATATNNREPSRQEVAGPVKSAATGRDSTQFLALGKCVKGQGYLEFFDVGGSSEQGFTLTRSSRAEPGTVYDPRRRQAPALRYHLPWLAIVRALHPWLSLRAPQTQIPPEHELATRIDDARKWLLEKAAGAEPSGLEIARIQRFVQTASPPPPESLTMKKLDLRRIPPTPPYINPQTAAFCAFIGIDMRINTPAQGPPRLLDISEIPDFSAGQRSSSATQPSA